jgi:tricorn protease
MVAAAGGPVSVVAHDAAIARRDYAWSPGGHYLAYTLTDADTQLPQIYVHDVAGGRSVRLGQSRFDAYEPAFSPDGQYLYFLGNREWTPQLSNVEWNFAANRDTGIFAVALRKGVGDPFAPRNDSASADAAKGGSDGKSEADAQSADKASDKSKDTAKGKPKPAAPVDDHIDFEGLDQRMVRAPIDPDNIIGIQITKKAIIYAVRDGRYYGRESAFKPKLKAWSFEDRKTTDIFEGLDRAAISRDGSAALVRSGAEYKWIDLNSGKPEPKDVNVNGLFALVDPKAEYTEIFREVWRRYRDYYYAKNMHGYDWEAIRAKYQRQLASVGDRSDLNYLIGQMVAELSSGHTYVSGGDIGLPAKPHVALLGARFELDASSGRYRIAKILKGQNDEERYRSPLTELGVNVKEGDYVIAINGQALTAHDSPYRLLRIAPGQLVQLTVSDRSNGSGARTVLVRPIEDEMPLNYLAWVEHNRDYVAKASNGEIGYLHIPDMGADGIREFIKAFYPQLRKQGLVIDVRDNGGGNVSAMVIERLARKPLGLEYARGLDFAGTYPQETFLGRLIALCNGTTASDGDIFSYMFKRAGLGPLIGVRTWGGVVGINDWGPVIDGGTVNVPQFASASTEGQYIVEGRGVDPDIVVEQDVSAQLEGKDPQLDRGIEELKKVIQAGPPRMPGRPADPIKAPPDMRPGAIGQ